MSNLHGKTIFITGASRGIGREIALRCARDGARVVITGKTVAPHPKLPGTTIATAAIEFNFSPEILRASRKPSIVADAAHVILLRDSRACSGQCFVDESVLRDAGVTDFGHYAVDPGAPPFKDLFLE